MRRYLILLLAGLAGFSAAALAGIAGARSFTLTVAKNAPVSNQSGNTTHEAIAVTSRGGAVYTLSGDTVAHPKCTAANQCFSFWPPVKVSSAKSLSKAPGIKGKLGVMHRGGFLQLTLSGHPLYTFSADTHKDAAKGEGIKGFGGTWHVVSAGASSSGAVSGSGGMTTTGATTTTGTGTGTTTTCAYPPYCY
jgi:predicted lipoprotein with Yx(FWY)xxD motif